MLIVYERHMRRVMRRVLPVALFGCAAWIWSRTLVLRLRTWERVHVRRIVGVRRRPGDSFVQHIQRATQISEACLCKLGIEQCHTRVLRSIFSLGGRISEFSQSSAPVTHRLLAGAIMWKSTFWWNFLSAASQVSGEPRRDSEVHATAGRPHVLWENVLCNALGPEWFVQANQPQIGRTWA